MNALVKSFKCPSCGEYPISILRFFFRVSFGYLKCKSCQTKIAVNHYFLLEFCIYFFIIGLLFYGIDYFFSINLNSWITTIVCILLLIAFMGYKNKKFFVLRG